MRPSPKPVHALLLTLVAGAIAGAFAPASAGQQAQARQSVYTEAQAQRGAALYKSGCASCHGDALQGRSGPPLTGADFASTWTTQPLSELAGKIRNTMPQAEPGTLTRPQTADIVAFILQTGKFPAGTAELSGEDAALKQISWPSNAAAKTAAAAPGMFFPPAGNMNQVMRGILFPSANIVFTVQSVNPAAIKKPTVDDANSTEGFNWAVWGNGIYSGWDMVDNAAIAIAESAPLMLTPGRKCENGRPIPVDDPDWQKFTQELADAGRAAYKASQTRNQEAVSESTNQLNDSCLHCHQVFRNNRRGRCVR
jgi:mono/diheme cytochrome c family protein